MHTPGPWKHSFESTNQDWAIVTNSAGSIIANVNTETGPDAVSVPAMRQMPAEANARLIAQAPALLEVCQKVRNRLWEHMRGPDAPEWFHKCMNELGEVIAKAKA
jgi:hypothetical protein